MTEQQQSDQLIIVDDLLRALAGLQPCECGGGLGIHVEPPDGWEPVVLHTLECSTRPPARLAVVR